MNNYTIVKDSIQAIGRECKVCGDYHPLGSDSWRAIKEIGKCIKCYNKTQKELKKQRKKDA
jgi:hypothetical protein